MNDNEVTLEVPIALQELILTSNELLKTHQRKMMEKIEAANEQMMQILQLKPDAGWKLDLERMVYARMRDETHSPEPSPIDESL
jgi:hypothetical protein